MTTCGFIPSVSRFWGRADRSIYSDHEIADCEFDNCDFPCSSRAGEWNTIRNVKASNVVNCNSSADTVCFQNLVLQNLKRGGRSPLFLWGCVFDQVKLEGKISAIKINRWIGPGTEGSNTQLIWDQAMIDFYCGVDWALDISEAKFSSGISFEAIPGDKVRINAEHQAVVRRERLESCDWREFDYDNSAMDIALSWFVSDSLFDSVVVAASTANRNQAAREIAVLRRLRDAGIAEPA